MKDEFVVEEHLEVQRCYSCGIIFALPAKYVKNRRDDAATFYCPNMHTLCFPKKDENGETLSAKADRLTEENEDLKSRNIGLLAQLDQAQAKLAELSKSNYEEQIEDDFSQENTEFDGDTNG